MASQSLGLSVGTNLNLEIPGGEDNNNFQVCLIGYRASHSVLVTMPQKGNKPTAIEEGAAVIVRYIGDSKVYAFESKVLHAHVDPYPYLHLEYPKGIQGIMMRRTMRVPVNTPVLTLSMLDQEGHQLSVTMADISIDGACLISSSQIGKVGDEFLINMPHIAATFDDDINLSCIVRYMRNETEADGTISYKHGVEFRQLDQAALRFIEHFIKDSIKMRQRA